LEQRSCRVSFVRFSLRHFQEVEALEFHG
jgi:hypothetical protein